MKNVINILKKTGAILDNDHFVGTSGRHFAIYINKDILYTYPIETSKVGKLFAEKYKDLDIEVVAAPSVAGIILGQSTAFHLSKLKKKNVFSVYTEKTPEKQQIFTRGYDKVVKGKKVLVIKDLTTTGGSIKKVIDSVRAVGGHVIAACVMVNRDTKLVTSESVGAPFSWLGVLEVPSYEASECPLCKKNVPVNIKIGHGKKFVESKKNI